MIKKVLITFLLAVMILSTGYKKPYRYKILPEKDAFYHNNVGLNYLRDRTYYAAIQEFKIAISLSPSTQASAVFYNNLGETYSFIGYPDMARDCFENALKFYGLNFKYYLNLVDCYVSLGIANSKIEELKQRSDVYSQIELGLLYIKTGEKRKGVNILDEVCASEPDLMITPAIRQYISEIVKEL